MSVTALIFGIVGTLLGALAFFNSMVVITTLFELAQKPPQETVNPQQNHNHKDIDDVIEDNFEAGREFAWATTQIAVYDMYRNLEILDYESHMDALTDRMDKITKDDNYREDLIKTFRQYAEDLYGDNDSN